MRVVESTSMQSVPGRRTALAVLVLMSLLAARTSAAAQDGAPNGDSATPAPPPTTRPGEPIGPRGLRVRKEGALPGYTLIAPLVSNTIHLVDLDGRVVHRWQPGFRPGSEIFLENGNLLRCCQDPAVRGFNAGGKCGRLQEIDWDGNVVWDWTYASDEHVQHHDLEVTPDGTILFIAYELKSRADCIAAGRHPSGVSKEGLWSEMVIEIEPVRPGGAEIVWEWHAWDHLIQDHDPDAENYGNVSEHPELLDLNADLRRVPETEDELEEMKKIGYVAANVTRGEISADWLHINAIDYDARRDWIVLSSPNLSEVFILDHSTTSDEAAGHEGGQGGRGGDFLWRWGNPANYGAGTRRDQRLFSQHDSRFIRDGEPGAGRILVFNNGRARPDGDYSSVDELVLPIRADGIWEHEIGLPFGPAEPIWSYVAPHRADFYSNFISGATRLANGNTLICEGARGRVFEVTPAGEIVWDYLSPFTEAQGADQRGVPPYSLFRATRIPADHPGLAGRRLEPLSQ